MLRNSHRPYLKSATSQGTDWPWVRAEAHTAQYWASISHFKKHDHHDTSVFSNLSGLPTSTSHLLSRRVRSTSHSDSLTALDRKHDILQTSSVPHPRPGLPLSPSPNRRLCMARSGLEQNCLPAMLSSAVDRASSSAVNSAFFDHDRRAQSVLKGVAGNGHFLPSLKTLLGGYPIASARSSSLVVTKIPNLPLPGLLEASEAISWSQFLVFMFTS